MFKLCTLFIIFYHILISNSYSQTSSSIEVCEPEAVINSQLQGLKNNNKPYRDAGIKNVWNLAHPSNKINTGPFNKFKNMIYSEAYNPLINHYSHKVNLKTKNKIEYIYEVEVISKFKEVYLYKWKLKIVNEGPNKDCWLTIAVSAPTNLGGYI